MKALILAAGKGQRLRPITNKIPKALIRVGGKEIIGYQLDYLVEYGVENFIIAVGALKEKIIEYVKSNYSVNVKFIYNPLYGKTNYIYTLWLTKEYVDDDVILIHGDLIFNKILLERLIYFDKNGVLVSKKAKALEKDFKAFISDERVIKIGVNVRGKNAHACMPMYKFKKEDFLLWLDKIEEFIRQGKTDVYAEDALNEITNKLEIYPLYFEDELCLEIDTKEDLEKAEKILSKITVK